MNRLLLILFLAIVTPQTIADCTTAPAFKLADENGHEISLPKTHNGVDVYVFWASWCPYCKALLPHLQSILIEYGDDVHVYALNIRDDGDPGAFLAGQGFDFTNLPKADTVMEPYGVRATPGLFLVDGQACIRFNLYELNFDDDASYEALSNRKKAARRAPFWAAEIRRTIDLILEQKEN